MRLRLKTEFRQLRINCFLSIIFFCYPKESFLLEQRYYPIDFGYPNSESRVLEFEIPSGFTITQKPADFSITAHNGFASYNYKSEIINGKIIVTQVFSILKPEVPVAEYNQVRDLYSKKIDKESELFAGKKQLTIILNMRRSILIIVQLASP